MTLCCADHFKKLESLTRLVAVLQCSMAEQIWQILSEITAMNAVKESLEKVRSLIVKILPGGDLMGACPVDPVFQCFGRGKLAKCVPNNSKSGKN